MLRRSSLFAMLIGGYFAAHGQFAPIVRVPPPTILEPWPQVGLDVRVVDGDGMPVMNVRTEQLTVRDDGHAVAGAELRPAEMEQQSVCLVLDRSASTYADREAITEETNALLKNLPKEDELCLVTFSGEPHIDVPFTMNHNEVAAALTYTHPSGGSALLDALRMAAVEMQANGRFRSQAIILVSDGGENASFVKYSEIVRDFAETGAPVLYGVITNDPDGRNAKGRETPLVERQKRDMIRLVVGTGGRAYEPAPSDRVSAIKDLVRVITTRYRLVYVPPSHEANGRKHSVDVQLSNELKKQKFSVDTSRSYYAPVQ